MAGRTATSPFPVLAGCPGDSIARVEPPESSGGRSGSDDAAAESEEAEAHQGQHGEKRAEQ
jgi:hypothetical protein